MAFKPNKDHTALIAAIASGATTHVGKTPVVDVLVKEGIIEVNPAMLDGEGNAAVRLTDAGKALAPASENTETEAASPEVSFFIADMPLELPTIRRGGGGARQSKYPLADIPEGRALFIPAAAGKKPSAQSKQFGSMISDFNKNHTDRYLTSRTVSDGYEAGFRPANNPEAYKGVAGIGIYRRPVSERPAPKPAKTV